MTSDEPIFDAVIEYGTRDFSAVVCWTELRGLDWCIVGSVAANSYAPPAIYSDRLAVAVDAENLVSLFGDLADDGFAIRLDEHGQVATAERPGDGHRLRVHLHYGPRYRSMPGRASRRTVLGRELPVAALVDVAAALLWTRDKPNQPERLRVEAELDLVRLAAQQPAELNDLLPADLRASADRDRQHALNYPDGDGWGDEAIDPTPQLVATPGTLP